MDEACNSVKRPTLNDAVTKTENVYIRLGDVRDSARVVLDKLMRAEKEPEPLDGPEPKAPQMSIAESILHRSSGSMDRIDDIQELMAAILREIG